MIRLDELRVLQSKPVALERAEYLFDAPTQPIEIDDPSDRRRVNSSEW